MAVNLAGFVRDVPDFPKKGIVFKDITPLLADAGALKEAVGRMAAMFRNDKVDLVASVEARGFIFGPAVAMQLGAGFVPVRKPGKLPCQTRHMSYQLEYGTDTVHIHADAIKPGQRVLLVDDLLATGGTIEATARLVEEMGGEVTGMAFLIELAFLKPRQRLAGRRIESLITVNAE
jgi:adenine phosphoribosyltransferase